MPGIVEAIVLGLFQGLTEFIPVSSSGHLVVVPALANWDEPSLSFDLVLHAGTLLAVAWYFRAELLGIVRGVARPREDDEGSRRLLMLLVISTIPAGVLGLAFEDFFEDLFDKPLWVCMFWGVTALVLLTAEWRYRHAAPREIGAHEALLIGLVQAVALAPGISRSGATIAMAIAIGVPRTEATRFSFLLSIPAISGAVLTAVPDLIDGRLELSVALLAGFAVALVSGYLTVAWLIRFVRTRSFAPFAIYLLFAAPLAALAL